MSYWTKVGPLCADHVMDGFTCGDDDMDAWFHGNARQAHLIGSAAVTVCTHPDDGIVGFFALVSHEVKAGDGTVASRDAGGLTTIPATLLARLGLRDDLRRQTSEPSCCLRRSALPSAHLPALRVA